MTLSSFIGPRPPAPEGMELMFMCTTVSTDAFAMTLAISGLRMSARTNSVRPSRRSISADGGTVSTPMTRSIDGSVASSAARAPPSHRLTPVTRTTVGGTGLLLVASLDAGLLQQLAVLLLRHPLAPLLDDRTHVLHSRRRGRAGDPEESGSRTGGDQLVGDASGIRRVIAGRPSLPAVPRRRCRGRSRTHDEGGRSSLPREPVLETGPLSGDVGVGVAQVVLDGPLRDAERTADADGGELAGVDEAVHGHLRDPHHGGDLGDGQEGDGLARLRNHRATHGHGGRVRGGHGAGDGGGHRATDRARARHALTGSELGGGCSVVALGHRHVFVSGPSACRRAGFPTGYAARTR